MKGELEKRQSEVIAAMRFPLMVLLLFCPCAADGIGAYRDEFVGDEYISFYFGGDIP